MATIGPYPLNRGFVSDADIWTCPPGGALTFYGFQPWGGGGAKTVDGFNLFAPPVLPSGLTPLGFVSWQDPAQIGVKGPTVISPSADGNIYSVQLNTGSWATITNGQVIQTTSKYTFDSLNGKLLLFGSGAVPGETVAPLVITAYNGNATTLGGSPPLGNIVKVVNNFAFVGQVLASPSTQSAVYWSAVADPTTWPSGNVIQFRQSDGDYITALGAIGSTLIIFKNNSFGSLSTSTTVISGAVTLGPLNTISDKIGCVSPYAVDSMPDGTLVFLAQDKHLYQTDGSIITDLSGIPNPSSNINEYVSFPFNRATPPSADVNSYVKVDAMFHRIFVLMGGSSFNYLFVYDYYYKTWSDWTEIGNDYTGSNGQGFITCLGSMPNQVANSQSLGKSVWFGTSNGYIVTVDPWSSLAHGNSTLYTCTLETSITLGSSSPPDFIPRQVVIPLLQNSNVVNGGGIKVFIGFDGVYSSTAAYTLPNQATIFPSRILVPVAEFKNIPLHPLTMQLKIILTGNSTLGQTIIEPIWISDEVNG